MTIKTAIKNIKNELIKKVKEKGIYENFGIKEARELKDKFINSSSFSDEMNKRRDLLQKFAEWGETYSG